VPLSRYPVTDPLHDRSGPTTFWTTVNAAEALPGVVTPLTWTLYAPVVEISVRTAFAELGQRCQDLLALLMRDPPLSYASISADLTIPVGSIGPSRARCLDQLRGSPAVAQLVDGAAITTGREARRDQRMVGR